MPTSLGPAEILVILVVALIVLGPKKLPEAGRQVGKAIAVVRKWSQGFQDEIKSDMDPEGTRPSYSQPQPGYDPPPLPMIPAETAPPADADTNDAHTNDAHTNDAHTNDVHTNGSGTVTTGSHGLISGPPPADTTPTDGPPAGDAPQP
jgi:sec-independent protein translocase protein TatA